VTALSSTNVGVLFYEPERPTAQPFSLTLLPGQHGIWYLAGLSYVFGHVSFTVTNAGTIDYDPELEGVLHGSGTNDLLVSGS